MKFGRPTWSTSAALHRVSATAQALVVESDEALASCRLTMGCHHSLRRAVINPPRAASGLRRREATDQVAPGAFANRPQSEYNGTRYATLAQSAEQPLRKRQVLGSIPKGGSAAQPPQMGASF